MRKRLTAALPLLAYRVARAYLELLFKLALLTYFYLLFASIAAEFGNGRQSFPKLSTGMKYLK